MFVIAVVACVTSLKTTSKSLTISNSFYVVIWVCSTVTRSQIPFIRTETGFRTCSSTTAVAAKLSSSKCSVTYVASSLVRPTDTDATTAISRSVTVPDSIK